MEEIVEFLIQHWQLSGLFLAVLIAYIIFEFRQKTVFDVVSAQKLVDIINHEKAVIFDLREKDIYSNGHIVGSLNVPVDDLKSPNKLKKLNKYAKRTIILVCAMGRDAPKAVAEFNNSGFDHVLYLNGGIHAWSAEGLLLTKK